MEKNYFFLNLDYCSIGELSVLTPKEKEILIELEFSDVLDFLKKEKEKITRKKVSQQSIEKILLHLAR